MVAGESFIERVKGQSGVALFRQQPWRLRWLVSEIAKLQVQTLAVHAPGLPDVHGHLGLGYPAF